jgi:phage shock protein A
MSQSIPSLKAELEKWKKHCKALETQSDKLQLECERLHDKAKSLEARCQLLEKLGSALGTQVLIQMLNGLRSEPLSQAYNNWRDEIIGHPDFHPTPKSKKKKTK